MEKDIQEAIAAFAHTGEATPPQEEESAPADAFFQGGSEADPDSTRVINLDDLQFGRNYTKD